jgi:ribosomal protein L25 (general stress protein Ctc)
MNKRVDQKKNRSEALRNKLSKILAILFCISLLILSVSITDMSTRKMIMCNDDKYAMAVSLQENSLLRLDIAGEKFMVNIEPVIKLTEYVASNSKWYCDKLLKTIRTETGE